MMTETDSKEQYIICSRCKCKYINDDKHIESDFGFNRLGERYKSCVKCRKQTKNYRENNKDKLKDYQCQYWIDNKDTIKKNREALKQEAEASNGKILYCNRCYKNKSFDDFVCPNGKTYGACYSCLKSRYG